MPTGDGSKAGAEDGAADGTEYETVAPSQKIGRISQRTCWIESIMIN